MERPPTNRWPFHSTGAGPSPGAVGRRRHLHDPAPYAFFLPRRVPTNGPGNDYGGAPGSIRPTTAYAASRAFLSFAERSKPENKTVVVDKAQILAQAPKLANLDTFCLSSATVRLNGSNQTWRVRCDPAELDVAYESYVKILLPVSTVSTASTSASLRQPEDLRGYLLFRVPNDNSTGCRDLATGGIPAAPPCARTCPPCTRAVTASRSTSSDSPSYCGPWSSARRPPKRRRRRS